jgi:hypothetical protein
MRSSIWTVYIKATLSNVVKGPKVWPHNLKEADFELITVFLYFLPFECIKALDKYHSFSSDVCKKKLVKLCLNAAHKKILSGLGLKSCRELATLTSSQKRNTKYSNMSYLFAGWLFM